MVGCSGVYGSTVQRMRKHDVPASANGSAGSPLAAERNDLRLSSVETGTDSYLNYVVRCCTDYRSSSNEDDFECDPVLDSAAPLPYNAKHARIFGMLATIRAARLMMD